MAIHLPIKLFAVGQLKEGPEYDLVHKYRRRLTHFEIIELKQSTKKDEEKLFLKRIKDSDYVIGLDEKGQNYSSQELTSFLFQKLSIRKSFCFLIGGTDGLGDTIKARCQQIISFGRLTWPHMLVRGMVCEQIYRATLIGNHHPYHRE